MLKLIVLFILRDIPWFPSNLFKKSTREKKKKEKGIASKKQSMQNLKKKQLYETGIKG